MGAAEKLTTVNEQLVSFESLVEYTGFTKPNDIREWLNKNRVRFFLGKHNRPFTTLKAFNSGLGIDVENATGKRDITL